MSRQRRCALRAVKLDDVKHTRCAKCFNQLIRRVDHKGDFFNRPTRRRNFRRCLKIDMARGFFEKHKADMTGARRRRCARRVNGFHPANFDDRLGRRLPSAHFTSAHLTSAYWVSAHLVVGHEAFRTGRLSLSAAGALAARLEADPNDPDGWVMLVRSYATLGDMGKARAAYEQASGVFEENPQILQAIQSGTRGLIDVN